ncbi:MAG: ABC transporter substrate-binding protein [Armatimonadota bacterium]|nr:ABC transporter substrate-binding protein [Armatimonadota bacterium]
MRRVMRRTWPLLVVVGLGALVVTLCGCPPKEEAPPEAMPPEAEPPLETMAGEEGAIKIGAIFDLSGKASALGQPEANTAEMLQEQINAEGGISGRTVEIIIRDTKGLEEEGLKAVKELIERENVVAIVGPSRSGTTLGIISAVEQAEVPLISCAAARAITDPVKKWVFNTPQSDEDAVHVIYEYLGEQGITKIATLTASSGFGEQGLIQLEKKAPDAELDIVTKQQFDDADTDMTAQLTKIKGTDAEAVVCWGIGPAPARIAKNMRQLGMQIPLVMSHGVANRRFIDDAGEAAEGIVLPCGKLLVAEQLPEDDPQKQLLLEYAEQYEEEFGKPADTFGGHAWDAVMLVKNAIEEEGAEPAAIRDGIESTEGFVGIGGVFNFGPDQHYGLSPDAFVMVKIQDGDWTLIE